MKDLTVIILLLTGAAFSLIASIGLLKFPDVFTRMHAAAKSGTLGGGLILLAVMIHFLRWDITIETFLIIVFFILTAPVSTHMMGRAAYKIGEPLWKKSVIDEPKDSGRYKPL